jgi:hypothetical protein
MADSCKHVCRWTAAICPCQTAQSTFKNILKQTTAKDPSTLGLFWVTTQKYYSKNTILEDELFHDGLIEYALNHMLFSCQSLVHKFTQSNLSFINLNIEGSGETVWLNVLTAVDSMS